MTDPEYIYFGSVTDTGEIKLPGQKMRRELAMLAGRGIEVVVRPKRKRRSLDQNNYYWGCIVPAFLAAFREWSPDTGWNAEMIHEVLKARFLPLIREWGQTVVPDTGEVIDEPLTTRKLTTSEFSHYKELIQQWGAEMGIIIADPGEQIEIFADEQHTV